MIPVKCLEPVQKVYHLSSDLEFSFVIRFACYANGSAFACSCHTVGVKPLEVPNKAKLFLRVGLPRVLLAIETFLKKISRFF